MEAPTSDPYAKAVWPGHGGRVAGEDLVAARPEAVDEGRGAEGEIAVADGAGGQCGVAALDEVAGWVDAGACAAVVVVRGGGGYRLGAVEGRWKGGAQGRD